MWQDGIVPGDNNGPVPALAIEHFPKNARVFRIYGADGCSKEGNLLSHVFYYGQGLLIRGWHYLEEPGRLHSKPHTIHCLDILDIWVFLVYYDVFVPSSLVVTHCLDICKCWNTTLPTLSSWQRSKPPSHWFQRWNWRGIGLWITRQFFCQPDTLDYQRVLHHDLHIYMCVCMYIYIYILYINI